MSPPRKTPISYTLGVVSPLVFDARVVKAQRVLNGGNVFGKDFLRSAIDGEFGEAFGRDCIRAKSFLGYSNPDLKPTYGPALDSFLHGLSKPTPEMNKRAAARQKKAKQAPRRLAVLAEARRHIGVKESPPDSNVVRFTKWYGITGPWCAMFVTYCEVLKGSKAFVKGSRYAYVPYVVADARAGRNGLQVTNDPKPGDVVCYDWNGGVADHIGFFDHWLPGAEGSEFLAVEGNTAVGNDSNGGAVMERHREIKHVECFVRVGR